MIMDGSLICISKNLIVNEKRMEVKPNKCIFIGIQRKNAEFWRL